MSSVWPQNGCDYLMRSFDWELRRHGYAGNSCQIILELAGAIQPEQLRARLQMLTERYPILNARSAGIFRRRWKLPNGVVQPPQVRVHRDRPELLQRLINEGLASDDGELMRFDLIECDTGRMKVVFTWAHALMDAHSAEHFVGVVGREDLPLPATKYQPPAGPRLPFKERSRRALKNFQAYNQFRNQAPRSPGVRFPNASAILQHRVELFTAEETAQVRATARKYAGALGEAQFHAAVTILEVHELHQRIGCASPSYLLPVPVGLRPKGNVEPLFSNQVTMLLLQFLPEHLTDPGKTIAHLKTQTGQAMRDGVVDGGVMFLEMLRMLPLPAHQGFTKMGLKGEVCSIFYGNTAAVSPVVTKFLGADIEGFTHVAAVPPSPGIGVIFYNYRGLLRVTVLHLAKTLSEAEAAEFAAGLRRRLLGGD